MAFDFSSLKKLFRFAAPSEKGGVIGIDIGSSSLKVVQLNESHGSVVLETYGELQLGPYAELEVGRATNLEPSRLTEALVDIVREASITSRNGALAVPYASSFVTVVTMPTRDEERLASMIPIEARKYVPVPITEVTLDWFVIPDKEGAEGANTKESRVLLAAIHNEALSKYRTAVRDANLLSRFSEIEVFSTIRSSVPSQNDAVMMIDIGAATTKLYIVVGGIVQATHSITLGGQDLTSALAQALELPTRDAEELKRQVGIVGGEDARIEKAMNFPLDRILTEAKRVLDRYERSQKSPVSSIILSGGGGTLQGLKERTEEILSHGVEIADPFSKVEYPAFLEDTLKEIGPSFAVAVGVALRRLSER